MYWAYLAAIVFGDGSLRQMEIAMRHNLREKRLRPKIIPPCRVFGYGRVELDGGSLRLRPRRAQNSILLLTIPRRIRSPLSEETLEACLLFQTT
jgi:hypothetical protein